MTTIIRTNDLKGLALAYAVAVAEGRNKPVKMLSGALVQPLAFVRRGNDARCALEDADALFDFDSGGYYHPHESWGLAGPIMEREDIFVHFRTDGIDDGYTGSAPKAKQCRHGHTHLVAAMRCYVAMKLGDSVAVPEYL